MIARNITPGLRKSLAQFPAVVLLGARQVGKTTLARSLIAGDDLYLDLERPSDAARLRDAESYLTAVADRMVVIDEVQRMPELLPLLRALIDDNRRPGRYLLLGSASPALRRQSSESLAGRVAYLELAPLTLDEVGATAENQLKLHLRGGFPDSFLAPSDQASLEWRQAFLRTFLERDLPQLGITIPAAQLRRFWMMLAHLQGRLWNASQLGNSLGLSAPTMRRYLDILSDTFMVRILQPYHVNLKKRLVKTPRMYLRDSGLLHALLGIETMDGLFGHPVAGASWEGMVLEHLIVHAGSDTQPYFYRTVAGAELDLVLESASGLRGYEVKFGQSPRVTKGYHHALKDLGLAQGTVVYSGNDSYEAAADARVVSLAQAIA